MARKLLFALSLLPFVALFYLLVGLSVLAGVACLPAEWAAERRARSLAGTGAGKPEAPT